MNRLLEKPSLLLEQVQAELGRRKLRDFVRAAWPHVEPARTFISNWHVDAICDHLQAVSERQIQYLLINIPPGHGKSLLVSVLWAAWIWAQDSSQHITGGPKWRGLFSSYDEQLSLRDSVLCRALLQSEWYTRLFRRSPDGGDTLAWRFSGDQNVKSYFQNTVRGLRMALSVGGRGTGFRGDAIVCDDPLNARDQFKESARRDVIFWWDHVMSSRLNDKQNGAKVIIMQRLHANDLSGHVLDLGGYEHLCLPSEYEPERRSRTFVFRTPLPSGSNAPADAFDRNDRVLFFEDPRTERGELLFPGLFPKEVLEHTKTKELGALGYAGQHQQSPMVLEGNMIKRDHVQYYGGRAPSGERDPELPKKFELVMVSVDAAFKDTRTSDYVALGAIGVNWPKKYVLEVVNQHLDLDGTEDAAARLYEKWGATTVLIEDKANGPAIISHLKKKLSGVVPFSPQDSKVARVFATAPEWQAGDWFVDRTAAWAEAFIAQCCEFPNGTHDDMVDMMTQAAIWLQSSRPRQAKVFKLVSVAKDGAPGRFSMSNGN